MPATSGWAPIDQAPKDRLLLLLLPPQAARRIVIGRWEHAVHSDRLRPYWTNDLEGSLGVRWVRDNQPTHYRLLPGTEA